MSRTATGSGRGISTTCARRSSTSRASTNPSRRIRPPRVGGAIAKRSSRSSALIAAASRRAAAERAIRWIRAINPAEPGPCGSVLPSSRCNPAASRACASAGSSAAAWSERNCARCQSAALISAFDSQLPPSSMVTIRSPSRSPRVVATTSNSAPRPPSSITATCGAVSVGRVGESAWHIASSQRSLRRPFLRMRCCASNLASMAGGGRRTMTPTRGCSCPMRSNRPSRCSNRIAVHGKSMCAMVPAA